MGCEKIHHGTQMEAEQCRNSLEQQNKKPYAVVFEQHGDIAAFYHYMVHEVEGCKDRQLFDGKFSNNEIYAKECARFLSKTIKGQTFEAKLVENRVFWDNSWQVVKK